MQLHRSILDGLFRPSLKTPLGRLTAIATICMLGALALSFLVPLTSAVANVTLTEDAPYVRDFTQEYLLARAALDHTDPYPPMAVLARQYLPEAEPKALPNPTPHPPTLVAIIWPLGLLPYSAASQLWLLLEVVWLWITTALIASNGLRWPRLSSVGLWTGFLLLLSWLPVKADLLQGQLMLLQAVLVVIAWHAYAAGRERLAGATLGLAASVKLTPLFLLLYFLIHRRWRVAIWTAFAFAAACGVAIAFFGPGVAQSYLLNSLPRTSAIWTAAEGNTSIFGIVFRTFAGSGSISPLIDAAWAATPLSLVGAAVVCAVLAILARRSPDGEVRFAAFVAAMVFIGPLSWVHYFVLLAWPIVALGRRLAAHGWPATRTLVMLISVAALTVSPGDLAAAASWLLKVIGSGDGGRWPFVVGLPFVIPTIGLILLLVLLLTEREVSARQATDAESPAIDLPASPPAVMSARRSTERPLGDRL